MLKIFIKSTDFRNSVRVVNLAHAHVGFDTAQTVLIFWYSPDSPLTRPTSISRVFFWK